MKSPKIIPRIFGGIGNQLFCYAAARRLALINNIELVIDNISGFARDYNHQRQYQLDHFNVPCRKATPVELMQPFPRAHRYLKRLWNRSVPFEKRSYIQQEGVDFDVRLLSLKPCKTIFLEGYWQSEQYFMDVESTIRRDLCIRPPQDAINMAMVERILGCQAVAMHIRFFDAPQQLKGNNVPENYYTRAIARMEASTTDAHYFIFSDQPAACTHIPLQKSRYTIVSNNQGDLNAYADLWLMSHCRHFIIANSTFSWWGAWLANNEEKLIIAPGFQVDASTHVTAWGFKGLLPDSWTKL